MPSHNRLIHVPAVNVEEVVRYLARITPSGYEDADRLHTLIAYLQRELAR